MRAQGPFAGVASAGPSAPTEWAPAADENAVGWGQVGGCRQEGRVAQCGGSSKFPSASLGMASKGGELPATRRPAAPGGVGDGMQSRAHAWPSLATATGMSAPPTASAKPLVAAESATGAR